MQLIVSKDKEEIRRALSSLLNDQMPITSFYPDNFSVEAFFQEVETLPFLSQKKIVVVHELDQLSVEGIEAIKRYLEKPNEWISLFLTAEEMSPQSKLVKLVENKGKVLRFKEEKPWEKEKRLAAWLVEVAKKEGVKLDSLAALALVQGSQSESLKCELDKLICFTHLKGQIRVEDISLLCTLVHQETLWQLAEALFDGAAGRALEIGRALVEEGMAIFPLLASLRTQFSTGVEILTAGADAPKKFPYLKGNLLEKKLQLLKKCGKEKLIRGILLIFETEVEAKNSSTEPTFLLELLIIKFIHDIITPSQFARTS